MHGYCACIDPRKGAKSSFRLNFAAALSLLSSHVARAMLAIPWIHLRPSRSSGTWRTREEKEGGRGQGGSRGIGSCVVSGEAWAESRAKYSCTLVFRPLSRNHILCPRGSPRGYPESNEGRVKNCTRFPSCRRWRLLNRRTFAIRRLFHRWDRLLFISHDMKARCSRKFDPHARKSSLNCHSVDESWVT